MMVFLSFVRISGNSVPWRGKGGSGQIGGAGDEEENFPTEKKTP